jgi:triacylglycerol lipase
MNIGDVRLGPLRFPCFRGIDSALAALGHPVVVTHVSPWATVATRARQLKSQILKFQKRTGNDQPLIILAHSMGGLDARHMLAHLAMADKVKALVTISTPHRGSPYADWMLQRTAPMNLGGPALRELSTAACRNFNARTPDHPRVAYFSVSAAVPENKIPLFARSAHRVIFAAQGDNDGRVSIPSAIWGTHLETWPADHWEQRNLRIPALIRDSSATITPRWLRLIQIASTKP